MLTHLLELIRTNNTIELQKIAASQQQFIPLFVRLKELNNKSLYKHLTLYTKLYHWSLSDFILNKLIDFNEVNEERKNLMTLFVEQDDLYHFQCLLLAGQQPSDSIFRRSSGTRIGNLLRYTPGRNNPSVYELSTKRHPNLDSLSNAIYDFYDTTDDETSSEELSDVEEMTPEQEQAYAVNRNRVINQYNMTKQGAQSLSFIAARGVHFVPKHFPQNTRHAVSEKKQLPHTTYSFSTLVDSGYQADDEPDERDARITRTHQRNTQFIERLKNTPDQKEKKTGSRAAPATRNRRIFASLYWREIQAYINSYDSLFNLRGIQINFSFESTNNPHLSLSWKTDVAGMYGGGVRFGWKRGDRLDPHYRRYDGKPKHPNIGYIDIYEFPLDYVRANGVDRLLAYNAGKIDLSNLFLAEAEIIFHSMIPKQFNVRRYIITLPSFNRVTSNTKNNELFFGIKGASSYTKARNGLISCIERKPKDSDYQSWITKRTEHAVAAQAQLIDKSIDLMLFKRGKVRAYDQSDKVSQDLPSPNH